MVCHGIVLLPLLSNSATASRECRVIVPPGKSVGRRARDRL